MKTRQPRYKQIFATHDKADEKAEIASVCWAEVIEHLEQNGLLSKTRLGLADRYCRTKAEYEILYADGMREGPTSKGSKGGEYANQKWHAVGKLNADLMKLEESLLISPKAAGGKIDDKPKGAAKTAASEFIDA